MKKRFIKWISSSKGRIEILWSVMAGMLFSMLSLLFSSGRSGYYHFGIGNWFDRLYMYYLDEFIFGFIFALILIWSIKKYRVKSQNISRTDSQDDWMDKATKALEVTPEEWQKVIEEHTFEELEKEEKARKG